MRLPAATADSAGPAPPTACTTASTRRPGAPALVLTGIDSRPDVNAQVKDSGTVGAAIAAVDEGVTALALSSTGDETDVSSPLLRRTAGRPAPRPSGMPTRRPCTGSTASPSLR
ncbi:5'/3'-nucleotidase SurE [Streptomyces sp. NPDC127117]|uniref:5'/3'-nucleotidase SurE n=1 Tax=Streptomyces sp. NPDC127117 TaxID=3345368 RepID=UPI003645A672